MKSYAELNAWLMDRVIAYAKAHRHPDDRDRTVWETFEAERPILVPYQPVEEVPFQPAGCVMSRKTAA